jgi:hypothetical protein
MEKEFVPYEQALELKELGFDKRTVFAFYDTTGSLIFSYQTIIFTPAPLYQQAFRWFREKYDILNTIISHRIPNTIFTYKISAEKEQNTNYIFPADIYQTYEEAQLECLKELIEIIKNK